MIFLKPQLRIAAKTSWNVILSLLVLKFLCSTQAAWVEKRNFKTDFKNNVPRSFFSDAQF
jgi:hypothetical protein